MTQSPYTKEAMQARFEELKTRIDEIERASPRVLRDLHHPDLTISQLADYKNRIKDHEAGLFELKTEYALLAKMLGGKSMSDGGP